MTRAVAEYAALSKALETQVPACADDWRFTAEPRELDPFSRSDMTSICRTCSLLSLCSAYARKGRPAAGMWAGKYYSGTTTENTHE